MAKRRYNVSTRKGFGGEIHAGSSSEAKKKFLRISKREKIKEGIVSIRQLKAKRIVPYKPKKRR